MSEKDKDKYVSTEEATGDNEQLSSDQFDMDKAPSQIKDFLKQADNFLLKVYRPFFFVYFIATFISFISIGLIDSSHNFRSFSNFGEFLFKWVLIFLPLIILMVWKKIFHPNN